MTSLPGKTVCSNSDCRHDLDQHTGGEPVTLADIKSSVFPCLYTETGSGTFAVCACRDFQAPATGQPESTVSREVMDDAPTPPEVGLTSDDVRGLPLGDIMLQLHPDGRVTWVSTA